MESKSDPKGSRGAPKLPPKTGSIFERVLGPILGPLWDHFGIILTHKINDFEIIFNDFSMLFSSFRELFS